MIDRIRYGFVIDMFKVEIFDFAVFNVADIFITVFCIAFILYILFGGEKQREVDEDEFDEIDYEEYDRPRREPIKKSSRRNDDYDDDDRPAKRAPAKKASSKRAQDDYDDDEYDEEDMPVRRTNKSAAAAANAYKRKPAAATEEAPQQKRPRPAAAQETAPSQSRQRRPSSQEEAAAPQVKRTQRVEATRKTSEELDIEKMLSSEAPAQRQRKTAPAAASTAQRKAPSSSGTAQKRVAPQAETKVPVYDPSNPFAEWEQANARASEKAEFNTFTETEKKPSVSDVNSAVKEVSKNFSSSDFSLDDILNEFK